MSISSCPQCGKQVTIPTGVGTSARVRCPLCHSQYTLADALVNMPPLLELIDDAPADWPEVGPEEHSGAGPMAAAAGAAIDFAPADAEDVSAEENDTEIEELSFTASDPLVRDVAEDADPIDLADPDENQMVVFEEAAKSEPSAEEELEFDFDEITPVEEREEEVTFGFDESPAAEAAGDGPEIEFGLAEPEEAQVSRDEESVLDVNVGEASEPQAGDEEIALDFGDPVEPETAPVALVSADDTEEPEGADAKGSKTKKKKKEKKAKAEATGEPRKRRPMSTLISALLGAVMAVPLTLYGMLWLGPDYDFLKIGRTLYAWSIPVPSAYSRPIYVAAKPTGEAPGLPDLSALAAQRAASRPAETPAETPATQTPASEAPVTETPAAPPADAATSTPPTAVDTEQPKLPPADEAPAATTPTEPPAAEPAPNNPPASVDKPEEPAPSAPAATPPEEPPAAKPADAAAAKAEVPNELPSPSEEPKPDEKPAQAGATETVGPTSATKISPADLAQAMAEAQSADEQMLAAQSSASEAELKKVRSNFYLSMFRLADAMTFAKDESNSGQLEETRTRLEQIVQQFAADPKRVDALKFNAARWLGFARRTTPGVMLAGTVASAQAVGTLFEVKLGIGRESDAPIVTVLAAKDPGLVAGDHAFALGTIVESPADNLAGYEGSEPSVVWSGMLVKVPAAK